MPSVRQSLIQILAVLFEERDLNLLNQRPWTSVSSSKLGVHYQSPRMNQHWLTAKQSTTQHHWRNSTKVYFSLVLGLMQRHTAFC